MGEMKVLKYPGEAGMFLREQRLYQRVAQRDMAVTVDTTQSAISDWEGGVTDYTLTTLMVNAAALGFRVALIPFKYEGDAYDD